MPADNDGPGRLVPIERLRIIALCSFPVRTRSGKWEIVQSVPLNEFGRAKTDASVAELKEEKSLVGELLG